MRNIAILALAALVVAVNGSSNLRVQMEAEVEAHNEKKSSWMFSHKPSRKEMMRLTVAIRVDDDVAESIVTPSLLLARLASRWSGQRVPGRQSDLRGLNAG